MPPTVRRKTAKAAKTVKAAPSSTASSTAPSTVFHIEDTVALSRPTTSIAIGSRSYEARAPKMPLWLDSGFLWERVDKARRAQERLASETILLAAEKRRLAAEAEAMPSAEDIHGIFIDGWEQDGRWKGGFLRRCLGADSYAQLVGELDDEDAELDLPEIYDAAISLYREFEPWFSSRASGMGLAVPAAALDSQPADR